MLELIAADEFPGSERYIGLGQLPSEALRLLWLSRKPVTPAQLAVTQAGGRTRQRTTRFFDNNPWREFVEMICPDG
jgi:hypothetical protein